MNNCKTCKHWDGPEAEDGYAAGFARCLHPKMVMPGEKPDGWWISDPAFALYTGPDFGCIHYEPK